jgi:hypothetical protein
MSKLNKFSILAFWNCLYLASAHSQEAIPVTGANASGNGGSVSYTVGQILYNTISGSNGTILQGVQQPYEISIVTGVEKNNINLITSVFPNPATDYLILRLENYDTENLSYWLYDINGNVIENWKASGNETQIIMKNFTTGTYFLKVTKGTKNLKAFKIIKN